MRRGQLENFERIVPRIYGFLIRGGQRIGLRISKVKLFFENERHQHGCGFLTFCEDDEEALASRQHDCMDSN